MKTMDIIFNNEDHHNELLDDLTIWCQEHSIPTAKVILSVMEDNVDGIDYYVITVNKTLFGYLMWKEYGMNKQYGREGWNRYIESSYNCEIV